MLMALRILIYFPLIKEIPIMSLSQIRQCQMPQEKNLLFI